MKSTKLKKLIMTDHHQSVLNVLEENVRSNEIPKDTYEIKLLDWEKGHTESDIRPIDMVIGSDIVFDSRIIPGLVSTLKTALQIAEIAIIANVLRNQETISEFQNCLSNHDLDFNVEVFDKEQMLLYQITNKT
jgi:predicted nicotinamide N-methyase